jgi:hypothetical protein
MKIHQFKNSSIEYYPSSGWFFWIVCYRKPWLNGKLATHETPNGYLYIKADGSHHSASRLAWELMNGSKVPDDMEIDHIDRNQRNNCIDNLRVVNRKGNLANRIIRPLGETGIVGVSKYHRPSGNGFMYRARHKDKVTYHKTVDEAIAGYAKLASEACDK